MASLSIPSTGRTITEITRRVSATIGHDFLHAIAKHLADALSADTLLVGEVVKARVERVRILAAHNSGPMEIFQYDFAGSAAAQVCLGRSLSCRSQAQVRFPADQALRRLGAQALIAVPLKLPETDAACGLLMAVYRDPVSTLRKARLMLEAMAPRAAAEVHRLQEEEEIQQSEQRYRAFVSMNTDAMWRVELDEPIPVDLPPEEQLRRLLEYGYVAECNDALARLLSLKKAEQVTGWRLARLAASNDPGPREANLEFIRSGYRYNTVETNPLDAAGRRRHMLRSQWGIVEDGHLLRIWGSNRDITDIRRIEEALDASEQRMADLLESLQLIVVILHEDGTIAYCNHHFYSLTGWQPRHVLGKDFLELLVPPQERDKVRAAFTPVKLESDIPARYESTLIRADGKRCWIAWDSTRLRDSSGSLVASAVIGWDISEYKNLEMQLREGLNTETTP
jgi:PAS domain S-box-containing protein